MARAERKRNDDINDIFSTFDEEFEEMRERMNQMMGSMLTGQFSFGEEPKVYGVSMRMEQEGGPFDQGAWERKARGAGRGCTNTV